MQKRKIWKKNISHHLKENGPIPRSKRNKGKTGIMPCNLMIWKKNGEFHIKI